MTATQTSLDARLVKKSNSRLVISGETYELYSYEHPYFYNWAPPKKAAAADGSSDVRTPTKPRRADNLFSARQRIRRLIDANKSAYNERLKFVTFTFARNVTNLNEANLLWAQFTKRMRREFGSLKYLAVVEFQGRGAIHYHVLYFNLPFRRGIKSILQNRWGHGWVKIITVSHVRRLGAYVCKYLQKDIMDVRLSGQKAFFCSKNLRMPEEFRREEAIDRVRGESLLFPEVVKTYESTSYGTIHYSQGLIQPL